MTELTDDNEDHAKQLDPRAQQRAEDHGILRWPEDVSMDVLPAGLFHRVLLVTHIQKVRTALRWPWGWRDRPYDVVVSVVVSDILP